jgi:hypothetical protein
MPFGWAAAATVVGSIISADAAGDAADTAAQASGKHQTRPSQSSADSTTLTEQTKRRTLRLALARSIG